MKTAPSAVKESSYILLVDDNSHGLIARKAVLEELGYKVATARSGEEALAACTARKFDLVVTDYKMPKMNGIELIEEIRKSGSQAPIILLSGFVEPLGLDEKSTGADVVISKSSGEVGNLVRSVSRLLSRRVEKKPPASQKGAGRNKAKA
jgi:CheY-like chemotaxis protein